MALHVVLYQPEIPQNTGNVMRTCAATGTRLHLIEPLGFKLDPKHIKRYGVNYLEHVEYDVWKDWETFHAAHPGVYAFFTRYGTKSPDAFDFTVPAADVYLVFGRESTGLPKDLLRGFRDFCLRLPMNDHVRSLNLSNVVCVGLYEALRQRGYPGLSQTEPETLKGADWLDRD
ncbi:MAG TPA: RNA methyltransferase [Acholeplasmatales bacterium]|nr:MAG: RNA methyltransferase [Tenericutes bacterium GWF2_57_13]HAQ55913.1 RNA methyltransferase [Acholeplasmatales bacterium]